MWNSSPMRVWLFASVLAVSASLFTKRTHRSMSRVRKKKAQGICLLEASLKIPLAYVFRDGSGNLLSLLTPVDGNSISAATILFSRFSGAWVTATRGRNGRCTGNRDISTTWHPKGVIKTTKSQNQRPRPCRQRRDENSRQNVPFTRPAISLNKPWQVIPHSQAVIGGSSMNAEVSVGLLGSSLTRLSRLLALL